MSPSTPTPDSPGAATANRGPTGNTYDKYATTNPVERRLMAGFFDALDRSLADALGDLHPDVVVEIGAGEGHITRRLRERYPDATVAGVDLPDPELAVHWRTSGLPMSFGDACRLPFADSSVDLVIALEVLEHVTDTERALSEIARVTSSAAVLSVPREPVWRIGNLLRGRYVRDLGNTPGHVNHWSARSFGRFVDTRLDVAAVRTPLPWTMVSAHRRR